jgi:hypothetical protein
LREADKRDGLTRKKNKETKKQKDLLVKKKQTKWGESKKNRQSGWTTMKKK